MPTTREQLTAALESGTHTLSELAAQFDLTPAAVSDHLHHVAKSLEHTDKQLMVSPPACRGCGFDRFDDPLNRPSRCPECKHERITDPRVYIES